MRGAGPCVGSGDGPLRQDAMPRPLVWSRQAGSRCQPGSARLQVGSRLEAAFRAVFASRPV